MFGISKNKNNEIWKDKALNRREKIKVLNKRIKELKKSRDIWKQKANNFKELNKDLSIKLKKNE